jgi:hypothetical protein
MIKEDNAILKSFYIKDTEEAKLIKEFSDALTIWNYPHKESKIYYCEWDIFKMGENFFEVIKKLIKYFNDDYIYFLDLMILNSQDANIYNKAFKQFPIVKFNVDNSYGEFISKLEEKFKYNKKISYQIYHTNTYSIIPSSGKWFFYGDYDMELGRFVLSEDFSIEEEFPRRWNSNSPAIYEKKDIEKDINDILDFYTQKLSNFNE